MATGFAMANCRIGPYYWNCKRLSFIFRGEDKKSIKGAYNRLYISQEISYFAGN